MKTCPYCKRNITGKSYLKMCPKCYNNFLHICLIIVVGVFVPVIALVVTLIVSAALAGVLGPIGIAADAILIVSAIIGVLVGYAFDIFLIIKLLMNN